jgi:hypothetical protein
MGGGQIPVARTDGDGRGISEPDRNDLIDRVFRALNGTV